jgi:DEAD/DEAH box helicase
MWNTGSGKTVAFGVAMAQTLLGDASTLPTPGAPLALVVAPTRELALQVERELTWFYRIRARAFAPASVAWTRSASAAPCSRASISSSARPGACATILNAARWMFRRSRSWCSMKSMRCSISVSARISNSC